MSADGAGHEAFRRCVGDTDYFAAHVWATEPQVFRGADENGFADLLSLRDFDSVVGNGLLRFPAVHIVCDGTKVDPASFTRAGTVGSVCIDDLIDTDKVRELFSGGATIVLTSMHRYWPPLSRFCAELASVLSHRVQVNTYLTPAGSAGLEPHYDTHDVFVLQVHGTKRWRVSEGILESPLRHQYRKEDIDESALTRVLECELAPGDNLYIPRGFVHSAETGSEGSLHLTVGILSYTWYDLFKKISETAAEEPEFRRSLPLGFGNAGKSELDTTVKEHLVKMANFVLDSDTSQLLDELQAQSTGKRTSRGGEIASIARLGELSDNTRVRPVEHLDPIIRWDDDGRVRVEAGKIILLLPAHAKEAVECLLTEEETMVAYLSLWLDEGGRVALVRRMIREGLVVMD